MALAGVLPGQFGRYWLSGFLADFGDGIRLTALPLLAAQLTRSPTAVAAVTALQGLPWLLTGVGLGVLVDRSDRRRLMVMVDVTRAVVIAGLAVAVLAHGVGLVLIYLTAFITGVGSALRDTAEVTCVPQLVDSSGLESANAQVIGGQIVGIELAGPAAGGWLFGLTAVLPFVIIAGTLGIAVLLLLTLPSIFRPSGQSSGQDTAVSLAALRHELGEGLRWLRRHRDVRDVTIAAGVISAMDAAWFAVLVLYVLQILHEKPGTYGVLLAIGGAGGATIVVIGPRINRRLGTWWSLVVAGLVLAVTQTVLGLTADVIIAAVMLAASSAAWALFDMTAVTMRQRLVPNELLGRITSLYGTVFWGCEALGALGGGAIAAIAGIRATMLVGAFPIVATIGVLAWRHRSQWSDHARPEPTGPADATARPGRGGGQRA